MNPIHGPISPRLRPLLACLWMLSLAALPLASTAQQAASATVSAGARGVTVSSSDGAFSFRAGGRLHADIAEHRGEAATGARATNGTEIRRARIELDGTLQRDWGLTAQIDFAGNEVTLADFVLRFTGLDRVSLFVGHQKQPYDLQLEMSTNDMPFIERSIDNALVAPFVGCAIGVRAETNGRHWFAAAGVFGDSVNPSGNGDEGWGTSGRFVYAPTIEPDRVLHLGVTAAYREPSDAGAVRIRDQTTHFSGLRIVDTGLLTDTRSVTLFALEAVYARGPWSVGGEYNDTSLDRRGASSLDFDGWHIEATYTLGGESRARAYRIGSGEFKRLQPAHDFDLRTGGRGTWELAARFASIDLNDKATVGGNEKTLTVGANWYANPNVRTLLSWTRILDTDASTPLRAGADGLDIFSARVQLAF